MAHNHEVYDSGAYFVINPVTRKMCIKSAAKRKVVQHDHNSESFAFVLLRYIDGHDMLKCNRGEVHYRNIEAGTATVYEGCYLIRDIQLNPKDPSEVVCSWLISRNATQYKGALHFLVRFACITDDDTGYVWSTDLYKDVTVSEGLYCAEEVTETYPDALAQWEARADALAEDVAEYQATLEQYRSETDAKIADIKLETDETLSVSGAAADSKTTGDRLAEIESQIADILYTPIVIKSFTNNVGTAEIGSSVKSVSLSWSTNKTPTTVALDGAVLLPEITGWGMTDLNITEDTDFTLKVIDERGTEATKTTSIVFLNGVYYGVSAEPEAYDSAFILTLTKNLRSTKRPSFTVNASAGEYIYYCLPTRLGTCAFTVGGFTGGFSLMDTISFTNASGYTEDYYVYRSDNAALGSTAVTVA